MTTIEKIHAEIDSAQDRLLVQARKIIETSSIIEVSPIETTAERLKKLGFTQTEVVRKAEKIVESKKAKAEQLVKSEEQARLIEYYSNTYPFLKFLTVEELDRICDKYNLIHAQVANYIKDVPVKNLEEIERAQVLSKSDSEEVRYKLISRNEQFKALCEYLGHADMTFTKDEAFSLLCKYEKEEHSRYHTDRMHESDTWLFLVYENVKKHGDFYYGYNSVERVDKSGLFIAAPPSHFNLKGLSKKSKHGFFNVFKTEVKDPIVFRYVRGGVQVLSKWGEEGNDPALVVPKLN